MYLERHAESIAPDTDWSNFIPAFLPPSLFWRELASI
jgi:hypothetical protein